ncbi:MAG TPA: AraC family transcriptional regulator [Capsulimonadaceae bacterium]|jgi:AraC-like DNA-binding protein
MRDDQQSQVFVGAECCLEAIRMAGHWRHSRQRQNTLKPHMHAHAFEICYVADGTADWWVEDRVYQVRRGQFYVTKPGELHGGVDSAVMPRELYWLQVAFPANDAFPGLTAAESRAVEHSLRSITTAAFDAFSDPSPVYMRVLAAMQQPSAFSSVALRTAAHELLLRVVEAIPGDTVASMTHSHSAHVKRAMQWMDEHVGDEYDVDDVAAACDLAASHLHRIFSRDAGMTIGDYRTRARVAAAKEKLRNEDLSITSIALDLGFSSSQYFATVFKNATGMTPRQYRGWSGEADPLARSAEYVD